MTSLDLNSLSHFASLSQKTVSTSSLNTLEKTEKCSFQTLRAFIFDLKVASESFSRKLSMTKFWFNSFLYFASLSQKTVSTSSLKNLQKTKISLSKCPEHSFLISRSLQNHFLKRFLWPILNVNDLKSSVSFSQKVASTSSPNNLQKTWKLLFSNAQNLRFWL